MSQYPIPAVGVFIFSQGGLYLIKKGRGIFEGKWCTPGGKIECGEEILDTVHREVKEETNLDIDNIEFITYEQAIERTNEGVINRHFVFFNFKATIPQNSNISPIAADDATQIELIPLEQLNNYDLSDPTVRTLKMLGILL